MGFNVDNDEFKNNSWFFRNALVRANYNDYPHEIHATLIPLEYFFGNLLLNARHDLKNRYLHVDYEGSDDRGHTKTASSGVSKCNNCTLDELAILKHLSANPQMTQKELAEAIGRSERTIKTRTVVLRERGLFARENGRRNGKWIVSAERDDENE